MRELNTPIEGLDYQIEDTKKETSDLQDITEKIELGIVIF